MCTSWLRGACSNQLGCAVLRELLKTAEVGNPRPPAPGLCLTFFVISACIIAFELADTFKAIRSHYGTSSLSAAAAELLHSQLVSSPMALLAGCALLSFVFSDDETEPATAAARRCMELAETSALLAEEVIAASVAESPTEFDLAVASEKVEEVTRLTEMAELSLACATAEAALVAERWQLLEEVARKRKRLGILGAARAARAAERLRVPARSAGRAAEAAELSVRDARAARGRAVTALGELERAVRAQGAKAAAAGGDAAGGPKGQRRSRGGNAASAAVAPEKAEGAGEPRGRAAAGRRRAAAASAAASPSPAGREARPASSRRTAA